jgi:dTMP kinase
VKEAMKGGRLISFEGIDGSGKDTQTRLLSEFLGSKGYPFELLSFPDYSTPIGKEIAAFLRGERKYPEEARHALYAANRYEHKEKIERLLDQEGRIVVVNRYCDSNIAYGVASGLPLEWLRGLESRMPAPDHTFLLRIPPAISASRMQRKDRDIFEKDLDFLNRVQQVYEALADEHRWSVVDGDRPVDSIQYEISQLTENLIGEGLVH